MNNGRALDDALRSRIRRQLARDASPVHVPSLIVEVEDLPTTHSGKRSEGAARDVVNGRPVGNLDALRNPASLSQIERQVALAGEQLGARASANELDGTRVELQAIWERVLGISPIDLDDNYFDLGGTSLAAVQLSREVYSQLGQELALSSLLQAPTIRTMAALLDRGAGQELPLVIPLTPRLKGKPLFMVHDGFGEIVGYRSLALSLQYDGPVYAIRVCGLDPREQPLTSVEDMAEYYLEHVRRQQPEGPIALIGHSLGGLIVFEMARRLQLAGEEVDFLGIIDSDFHESCLSFRERVPFELKRFSRRLLLAVTAPREKLQPFVEGRLRQVRGLPSAAERDAITPLHRRVQVASMQAFRAYRPQAYSGRATFFQATVRRLKFCDPHPASSLRIWSRVIEGGLTVRLVPGGHTNLLQEPHVDELARVLSDGLATSRARADVVPSLSP
jgi:acetoacetyl-CoA synthetase